MKFYIPSHPFRMSIHNLVGHPLMEIFTLLGLMRLADWIHDTTLPPEA